MIEIEINVENLWIDAIRPRLPECRFLRVDLAEYPGKVVYLAWFVESWIKPHKVEAYGDHRFC